MSLSLEEIRRRANDWVSRPNLVFASHVVLARDVLALLSECEALRERVELWREESRERGQDIERLKIADQGQVGFTALAVEVEDELLSGAYDHPAVESGAGPLKTCCLRRSYP